MTNRARKRKLSERINSQSPRRLMANRLVIGVSALLIVFTSRSPKPIDMHKIVEDGPGSHQRQNSQIGPGTAPYGRPDQILDNLDDYQPSQDNITQAQLASQARFRHQATSSGDWD